MEPCIYNSLKKLADCLPNTNSLELLSTLNKDPISKNASGDDIYLKDIWPSNTEIQNIVQN